MIRVIDFFCGCGGTSAGLQRAGMEIVAAIDSDHEAAATFQQNFPSVKFFRRKIEYINATVLDEILSREPNKPLLFSACAPCQPFSKQNRQRQENDHRKHLLLHLCRFIRRHRPDYLFIENVPGLQDISTTIGPFAIFLSLLDRLEYRYDHDVIVSSHYGVPQTRRRLVLVASLHSDISLPAPKYGPGAECPEPNVWDVIKDLPPIAAGETHEDDNNHRAAMLSELNLKRIRATPEGGNRLDWPADLVLNCHRDHDGHTDVYGRLRKDAPAPALTTRCISYSNGRYGHPVQDRAISVREAACIQTFPREFTFCGSLNSQARQIGNAVPVDLARAFGEHIIDHNAS